MTIKNQVNVVLNMNGCSFVIMVSLQVMCQRMDESEFKLGGQIHEIDVPQNQHSPVLLSSWYHYKSLVNIWMKTNLSWMVRFMKQMKLRNTFFYRFGNTFENELSHPSTLFTLLFQSFDHQTLQPFDHQPFQPFVYQPLQQFGHRPLFDL